MSSSIPIAMFKSGISCFIDAVEDKNMTALMIKNLNGINQSMIEKMDVNVNHTIDCVFVYIQVSDDRGYIVYTF